MTGGVSISKFAAAEDISRPTKPNPASGACFQATNLSSSRLELFSFPFDLNLTAGGACFQATDFSPFTGKLFYFHSIQILRPKDKQIPIPTGGKVFRSLSEPKEINVPRCQRYFETHKAAVRDDSKLIKIRQTHKPNPASKARCIPPQPVQACGHRLSDWPAQSTATASFRRVEVEGKGST